ncbi:MAG TPA: histidine phosphatase family protein [Coriobacteriia bacterium]
MSGSTRTVELLLARHPEVEANVGHVYVGRGESPYTPRGEQQKAALAKAIGAWGPDLVRSSPIGRARLVAELVAQAGVPHVVDDDLTEIDFGHAEGMTYDEAHRHGIPMDFLGGPADARPFGGGETWGEFGVRLDRAANGILAGPARVAIVTHGGVFRGLIVTFLGLEPSRAWRFSIPPASVATLTLHGDAGTLRTFGLVPGETPWELGADVREDVG